MKYDIVIVGGGMVGLAFACAIAKQTRLSIAIIEAQATQNTWTADEYHHRVSAIALSSKRIFQSLDVWDLIKTKRISPFKQIQVWDAAGRGEIQFYGQDIAEATLGYIIENNVIQSALTERLAQYPQVTLLSPIKLTQFIDGTDEIILSTDDGREFKAQLVVAADGANSWLRQAAGMSVDFKEYEQEAIVATVKTTLPHEQIARQSFLASGPLAFLPLAESNTTSIVWSLPPDTAKHLLKLETQEFKQALAQAFSQRLGEVVEVGPRYAFPLRKQHAKQYVKSRIALMGDAAHTVHPLAGQGVNMGLLDAACLAEVIVDAIDARRDFTSLTTLRRYERWRKADNHAMLTGVDAIKQLFASAQTTVTGLRTLGLSLTNKMRWIKNFFTRHAVGNRAGLPKLASTSYSSCFAKGSECGRGRGEGVHYPR